MAREKTNCLGRIFIYLKGIMSWEFIFKPIRMHLKRKKHLEWGKACCNFSQLPYTLPPPFFVFYNINRGNYESPLGAYYYYSLRFAIIYFPFGHHMACYLT